ncbi:MAG: hypothetical protein M3R30_09945 [Candidatus Eremiobacteraeota bacterium]|nr:hypothetical protein [Candidatus Eremiobacteraeota bacterium]
MTTNPTGRRGHKGTWILAIFALLELAAIILLIIFRVEACALAGVAQVGGNGAGGTMVRAGGSGTDSNGAGGNGSQTPTALPSISPLPNGSSTQGAVAPGQAGVQPSQSPVPDSNCMYKTASSTFGSPAPNVSCAPASTQPGSSR